MSDDGLRLDDQLCFALYAATHAVTRSYRPLLGELGLTYPQYLVMMTLWQHGPLTVGAVADLLLLDSHAVTPLARRLEHAGLVRREAAPDDRRQVVLEPTEAGRLLEREATAVQARVVCETGLDDVRLADLRRRLHDLVTHMDVTSGSPARRTSTRRGDAS